MKKIWSKKVHHVRISSDSTTPTKKVTGWFCQKEANPGKNFENIHGPFSSKEMAEEMLAELETAS